MKRGFRPPLIRQIFAPVPAARSRCISTFIAIARQNLPLALRYEASHLLTLLGLILLVVGFFAEALTRFAGTMMMVGWGLIGCAMLATLGQDRLVYGKSRSRLIRQLDEVRRSVGLDSAILPESLEFLESVAQQWERIEHALQDHVWLDQEPLRQRIDRAAHAAMEDIVVLECGTTEEVGLPDEQAEEALAKATAGLVSLADKVDAVSAAITTYPREAFDSNGVSPEGVIPEFEQLEEALASLNQVRSR